MTMVNSTVPSAPNRGVSLRKTNKPLMEKRRRARINDSLSQLKSLVIHSSKKDSSQFNKLEKADILELTVKHLRGLQTQQHHHRHHPHQQHPLAVQPAPNGPADALINGKYQAGFVECANEVIRYMDQSQGLNQETKTKVISHLANCLQLVSTSQPKIAPQPIPQQTVAPPTNAAAILAAAAAAAGNTTTTTQLPSGQIIQIVSNPLQNAQQGPAPAVLGLSQNPPSNSVAAGPRINILTHSEQNLNQSQSVSVQASSKPSQNPAYVHYAQPLHIQIPPIVSPVLVQKSQATKKIEPMESSNNSSLSSSSHSSILSSTPEQDHDVVSSSTSVTSSSPRTTTTPPSLYPGHPKARAQKQLNFYSQETRKSEKYQKSNHLPMTPSSSSSESENTSPLNLSQSPPFSLYKTKQGRSSMYTSQKSYHEQKQSICPYPTKSMLRTENRAFKDGSNIGLVAPNATSVIVNSRRCGDLMDGKYWSMVEEERHCHRQRSTPSPASSVGEERLWRPW